MRMLVALLIALVAAVGCAADDEPTKASSPPASNPSTDPCVAVRADYFWQEQRFSLANAAGGGAITDPFLRATLARYKLDHPTCFF